MSKPRPTQRPRIALVVPHVFINRDIFDKVIFSPGQLALDLADGLTRQGLEVTLFTPGPADTSLPNQTADMSGFRRELKGRGYGYMELLKKHPLIFISLARQVQAEIIARAYQLAADGQFDLVHIYTNEEDIGLQFAGLCPKPVLFTHHDPYNFLVRYKAVWPRYRHLNQVSISLAQRAGMPADTNWVANIYHGLDPSQFPPSYEQGKYFAYLGRIIESKGVHLAIEAALRYNSGAGSGQKAQLKIAGRYYGDGPDDYWAQQIKPHLGTNIEYVGPLAGQAKVDFLRQARALMVPSQFEEPFGMVTIEALTCGTPVIGSTHGATPEIITDSQNGFLADQPTEIAAAMAKIDQIDRHACRQTVVKHFTLAKMVQNYADLYQKLTKN